VGYAEVEDARSGRGEDDVLRLDVAVDDAGRVDGGEGLGGAGREGVQGAAGEGPVLGQVLAEGGTRSVRGRQPGCRGLGVGGQQGYEAGALHTGGELHLAAEPGPELRVLGLRGVDHLDGDPQPLGGEAGVDGTHAAGAESRPTIRYGPIQEGSPGWAG
jgi:hypothetical protein